MTEQSYNRIEDYGIIGNLHTVALVSNQGSIDYMCLPWYDSPTVFGALLDNETGGQFYIRPDLEDLTYKQLYLTDSAILLTRFFSEAGMAELTDFMPVDEDGGVMTIVRKVTAIRGDLTFNLVCRPRFNYARDQHTATVAADNRIVFESGENQLHLWTDIPLQLDGDDINTSFSLKQGETICFVLQNNIEGSSFAHQYHEFCLKCYTDTYTYWRNWINQCNFTGRWVETVRRSSITLKLLTSYKQGSVIAAATFGLPEILGGKRNWDYRYAWIRDASFTMYIFLQLGFMHDAECFMKWIEGHCIEDDMHLLYTWDGKAIPDEEELEHFSGYKNSKPVLIGNGAKGQKQMDIYGELIDTIYLYNKYGGQITYNFWKSLARQVEYVIDHWQDADHGIWEVRGDKKEFLHSRLMCWVAVDRAIKIADHRSFPYPLERWHTARNKIYIDIYENFWNEDKQSFVQAKGSDKLDASVLLMPLVRYMTPTDERWLKTLEAVERELKLDVLIYRYLNNDDDGDGLDGEEGTFTICSFWYAECLAKSGQAEKANEVFAKLLGYGNPLRLFSEQLSKRGEQLGNFPQGFTHLGLISAAIAINKLNYRKEN
ncbi:glycoside hydrolase family 15 protein [Mucilaginibacter koreensis]